MSIPLLVSEQDVFDAMGQNPDLMEDSKPAVASAIARAIIKLEGVLKTCIRPQLTQDVFYVSGLDGAPLNNRYNLRLTNGCVSKDTAVSVRVSDDIDSAYSDALGFSVDLKRGVVSVVAKTPTSSVDELLGKYITVMYASGFDSSESTPDEIRQALLCFVPSMLLSTSQAALDPKAQAAAASKASSLDSLGADMASSYLRPTGNTLKPISSTVLD